MIVLICFLLPNLCFSQLRLLTFQELEKAQTVNPKPTLIFIYTDWCKYCKSMKKILEKEHIRKILNGHFYTLNLNAEERHEINFTGRLFKFRPTGIRTGVHELAQELGTIDGQLSYPSLVILNPKNEIIFQYAGFLNAKTLGNILSNVSKKY